jgi:hypothetical protein
MTYSWETKYVINVKRKISDGIWIIIRKQESGNLTIIEDRMANGVTNYQ